MQLHRYSFQYTIDALCKAGAWLAALCLLVLALVVSYEVVVRYTGPGRYELPGTTVQEI